MWVKLSNNMVESVISPKITKKRDKNSLNQHPNTSISFKRGYKCKGEREGDPSSPQSLAVTLLEPLLS